MTSLLSRCWRLALSLSSCISVAANSLWEFVALAKAQPGKINFASAGLGTAHIEAAGRPSPI
nr:MULTISPECIES: tripartite tricarboxylate transporter substrate-binding protein [unclassified Bradyrhizobium]